MARFRNDTGSVITVNDLGQTIGPYEEFDWPGYDPAIHGPVAGCSPVPGDEPGRAIESPGGGDAGAFVPPPAAAAEPAEETQK